MTDTANRYVGLWSGGVVGRNVRVEVSEDARRCDRRDVAVVLTGGLR